MSGYRREKSESGIYHVMCRGVNKQQIFEDDADLMRFVQIMGEQSAVSFDEKGDVIPPKCAFYAYCLMPNHIHLLIRETGDSISNVMQNINKSYATYYNVKYKRVGHLFQNRFKSEPVRDWNYFVTLLRYIHQNPVVAEITERAEQYPWSSWREYLGLVPLPLCNTRAALKNVSLDVLRDWVDDLLPDDSHFLDIDMVETRKERKKTVEDDDVRELFRTMTGVVNITEFQSLDRMVQADAIFKAHYSGASFRQLQRLTGLTVYQIRKTYNSLAGFKQKGI